MASTDLNGSRPEALCRQGKVSESELYSIQQTAQDSVSIGRVVARVLWGIGEISEDVETEMILESDSSSAIQLIQQTDVPKRSRHIEIRLLWLRSQISEGKLALKHRPGLVNMADLFTKCLGSLLFERHRRALGFEPRDIPISMMKSCFDDDDDAFVFQLGTRRFALVEVCCEPDSQLSVLTLKGGIPYVGVVKDVQSKPLLRKVSQLVSTWSNNGFWTHLESHWDLHRVISLLIEFCIRSLDFVHVRSMHHCQKWIMHPLLAIQRSWHVES